MKRLLLNVVTVVSLLLCAAVVALWVRSYWATESLRRADAYRWHALSAAHGRVMYLHAWPVVPARPPFAPESLRRQVEPASADVTATQWLERRFAGAAGFAAGSNASSGYQGTAVVAPLWFPPLLSACLSAALLKRRRARLRGAGLCTTCGYDLRVTPERCPECSTPSTRG